jgi:AraC-like DNA-binding protein
MQYPPDGTRHLLVDGVQGRWEMRLRAPMVALRSLVRGYCIYDERRREISTHQHVPHRDCIFIVSLEGALEVHDASGARRSVQQGEGFLGGVHTRPAHTRSGPRQRGVEVSLTPLGAHLLLGRLPMHALANHTFSLDELLGDAARTLVNGLEAARGAGAAFAVLDDFFGERILGAAGGAPAATLHAWRLLARSHGCLRIGELAAELGWSRKRLGAEFRERVGLPPKTMARVLRFDRAMQLLTSAAPPCWSDLALACGYHDQAHLAREVRELSGSTPGELARRLVPDAGALVAA